MTTQENAMLKKQAPLKNMVPGKSCPTCATGGNMAYKVELLEKELFQAKNERVEAFLDSRLCEERLKTIVSEQK